MTTIHLVSDSNKLSQCTAVMEQGDTLILTGACVSEAAGTASLLPDDRHWFALEEDLLARGLRDRVPEGRQISIAGMTSLIITADKQVAW